MKWRAAVSFLNSWSAFENSSFFSFSYAFSSYLSHSSKGNKHYSTSLNKESSLNYKSSHSANAGDFGLNSNIFPSHCIWIGRWINSWMDWVTQQVKRFCQFETAGCMCVEGENFGPRIKGKKKRGISAFERCISARVISYAESYRTDF